MTDGPAEFHLNSKEKDGQDKPCFDIPWNKEKTK